MQILFFCDRALFIFFYDEIIAKKSSHLGAFFCEQREMATTLFTYRKHKIQRLISHEVPNISLPKITFRDLWIAQYKLRFFVTDQCLFFSMIRSFQKKAPKWLLFFVWKGKWPQRFSRFESIRSRDYFNMIWEVFFEMI